MITRQTKSSLIESAGYHNSIFIFMWVLNMFVYEEARLNDKLHDKMRLQVEWYGMMDKTIEDMFSNGENIPSRDNIPLLERWSN